MGDAATMATIGEQYVGVIRETYLSTLHPYATGALEKSISVRSARARAVTVGAGGTLKPAARAIEYGTKERQIYPNRAARLAFFWKKKNRNFVGRIGQPVTHPAVAAQPFFAPAFASPPALVTRLKAVMVDLWNGAA